MRIEAEREKVRNEGEIERARIEQDTRFHETEVNHLSREGRQNEFKLTKHVRLVQKL